MVAVLPGPHMCGQAALDPTLIIVYKKIIYFVRWRLKKKGFMSSIFLSKATENTVKEELRSQYKS